MRKRLLAGLATVLFVFGIVGMANATVIDLWEQFPDNQGDNNFFAYGWSSTAGYRPLTDVGSYYFKRTQETRWGNPQIGRGSYGDPWVNLQPSGTLSNTGSPEDAVLAWVVSTAGDYQLEGAFYLKPGSRNGVDAYIKQNDTILWASYMGSGASMAFAIDELSLIAGDMLYFGVGAHNTEYFSEYNDWPLTRGQIEHLDPVPVPATMFLFGTGLAGLAGIRVRRKKK